MSSSEFSSSAHIKRENQVAMEDGVALPGSYGVTAAYLLTRDPHWLFLCWEITEETRQSVMAKHGGDIFNRCKTVIRVYDVTDGGETRFTDVPAMLEARRWYVNVPESGRSYCCEVGLLAPDGTFIALVRSNKVALPPGRISNVSDEKWMSVSADFDKLLQLSGVEYIGRGSGEFAKILSQRWEMLRAVSSRSASWGAPSSLDSGRRVDQSRGFWLVADCELILYGATLPDAKVTVLGRSVKLNPDGTFAMRFALPDGRLDMPIRAESSDGVDRRSIDISVQRQTETDENR
ncbi:MAG TPA: DUF4912 domain-containing protein [Elusimicrobiales bacterium]|nr:DUF4912 domain-containing protein [Elusimicrobiales bacterium]